MKDENVYYLENKEGIENIDTWFSDAVNQTKLQM